MESMSEHVHISAIVDLDMLPTIDSINKFLKTKENTDEIKNYLNWKKSKNELISFCRAVCKTNVPKKFDFLIDLEDNFGGIEVKATISHAIWNGIIPLNYIDLGYKTITIIKFDNGIPERLNNILKFEDADFKPRFVLCSKSDKKNVISLLSKLE